ncbi:GH92 family glycosyl hydrolase [Streptococcus sp. S784/96/1]|uniref:GH92 family glycosyl hydrolase n=1 Tax=Streptococcus sp. S784/96/1 TaxID=2653499 RepID=UPI001386A98D|nr:GH92 family glycosyl hydrolase [Streptococcus sp. S784/96/1]
MTTTSQIDTRLGTYNSHSYSNGNCLPLTAVPWGMNAFCLQTTDQQGNWFFNPYEPIYQGIRLTHQPSPWLGDFATFLITPVTGPLSQSSLFHRQSSYQLNTANFRPDYLKVHSTRYQVTSELTPTCYGASCRFTSDTEMPVSLVLFAPDQATYTYCNDKHIHITLHNATETQATYFSFYMDLLFSEPIKDWYSLQQGQVVSKCLIDCHDGHIRLNFHCSQLEMTLATSYISAEQSLYQARLIGDFDTTLSQASTIWEQHLNRITIHDKEPSEQKAFFYHCLYRTLLYPQTFHEITENGDVLHFDTKSGQVKPGRYYTNNGYWDTFRSTYPFYSLLYPDQYQHFLEGILNHYQDTGFLPKWLSPDERGIMPGTLVDGVIADAASKGIGKHLLPQLLQAMETTRHTEDQTRRYGRHGAKDYQQFGYLPNDYHESVSHSLDYAYSDWCIGQVAKALGQNELAQAYESSSLSYRQLFDPNTGYIRSKNRQGQFRKEFSPKAWGCDYAECSAIQATLGALHDINGLIALMGGKQAFTDYLDDVLSSKPLFDCQNYGYEIHEMSEMAQANFGQLAISNQPSFHIPYLYQFSQTPERTAQLIQTIRQEAFLPNFQGFPGDEDNGSLAAWYLFACLGFYPVCPGNATYQLGQPAFRHLTLHLEQHDLHILHDKLEPSPAQLQVALDGKRMTALNHHDLITAKELIFVTTHEKEIR